MGQGNQKCFDLCAGKVGSQRKNPLQNGSALNQAAGVTEELKARDPMRWVGLMNTLKAQAEEIIFSELIWT